MFRMRALFQFICAFVLFMEPLQGQILPGTWRDHLPYSNCIKVSKAGNLIYCASSTNLFTYDITTHSLNKLSKINGLSDIGISSMEYDTLLHILVIAYTDGNIDLMQNNTITNIPDIYNNSLTGSKAANQIYFLGKFAYICYDFGVVVLNLNQHIIQDTYYIGDAEGMYAVQSFTSDSLYFYAATTNGIFKAAQNDPVLVDYAHWQRMMNIPYPNGNFDFLCNYNGYLIMDMLSTTMDSAQTFSLKNSTWKKLLGGSTLLKHEIRSWGNHLLISASGALFKLSKDLSVDSIYTSYGFSKALPNSALMDASGNLWIGDGSNGLVYQMPSLSSNFAYTYPNGPISASVYSLINNNGVIFSTSGGVDASWNNLWRYGSFCVFSHETWKSYVEWSDRDFMPIAVDPLDTSTFYIGSWNEGLFQYQNYQLQKEYVDTNSILQTIIPNQIYDRIGGLAFDSNDNLWISCSQVNNALVVKETNGNWKGFDIGSYLNVLTIGPILVDNFNQIWMMLPRGNGLFVYNFNNTIDNTSDDQYLKFNPISIYGDVISNIFCITLDNNGSIWVGSDQGVVVYSDPSNVLNGETAGIQPAIPRNDGTNIVDPLMENQTVNCIAVDGANRKWIGTNGGGAFLVAGDGTRQILNFNTSNSPLISNNVLSIAINSESGEVFFATDIGIISYRADATQGSASYSNVYVFPNPVRDDFHGNITITGLMANSIVKITDVAGNLVYETTSLGGQAIWDGKQRNGSRVATGIYLVFCNTSDGNNSTVTKLLVIH